MGIYTRRGDSGQTGLADGSRTSKASTRVEAYGTVDEAAAALGFARQAVTDPVLQAALLFAQHRLFNITSSLANPSSDEPAVSDADVAFLEAAIDQLVQAEGAWRGFVLASGGEAATRLHLARTIVRRAERRVAALSSEAPVDAHSLAFLNRISDLLFAAARATALHDGIEEDLWDRSAEPPSY
ncbi:MAG: cob(I)yrinic acid a,c-diamide adenosyltransferase [Coriobacteriia bacterium]|nr:cob(I)yrinic acid a,c-diamide adenosyltransferase [Coriobacteriia bacterium]